MHARVPIRAVLFDLGGVLLDIDFERAVLGMQAVLVRRRRAPGIPAARA